MVADGGDDSFYAVGGNSLRRELDRRYGIKNVVLSLVKRSEVYKTRRLYDTSKLSSSLSTVLISISSTGFERYRPTQRLLSAFVRKKKKTVLTVFLRRCGTIVVYSKNVQQPRKTKEKKTTRNVNTNRKENEELGEQNNEKADVQS